MSPNILGEINGYSKSKPQVQLLQVPDQKLLVKIFYPSLDYIVAIHGSAGSAVPQQVLPGIQESRVILAAGLYPIQHRTNHY